MVREIQTAAPLMGVILAIDKNQDKKNWERAKMSIEQLEIEFKRYEDLENENGYKGNREAAYYYMNRKWETFDIIMDLMRGEK